MKEAFLQHIQAKKKRRQREASKYVLAVMQDVREGRKMACESLTLATNAELKTLTLEQVNELAEEFFPQFNAIHDRMPGGSTARDTLAVWEKIAELAGSKKKRAQELCWFLQRKSFVDSPESSLPQFNYLDFYSSFSRHAHVLKLVQRTPEFRIKESSTENQGAFSHSPHQRCYQD